MFFDPVETKKGRRTAILFRKKTDFNAYTDHNTELENAKQEGVAQQ